jgi:hypothetical protein
VHAEYLLDYDEYTCDCLVLDGPQFYWRVCLGEERVNGGICTSRGEAYREAYHAARMDLLRRIKESTRWNPEACQYTDDQGRTMWDIYLERGLA